MNKAWKSLTAPFLLAALVSLSGCGQEEQAEVRDNTQEVLDYYAANPEFFSFKTLADLPDDLVWINNMDLPEIGSPNAKKGGTQYEYVRDFPRTLRHVGPDSNGSFRPYILDYTKLFAGHRHPDKFEFIPGVAKEWAVSKERKTVYVRLDPDARWSDGVPFTANDILFSFFFYQSKYIVAPWYNNYYNVTFDNITKYDDLTYSVSLPEARPDMDYRALDITPIPQHFFKELGDDYVDRYQWKFMPTTGPYIIKPEDIRKGRSITLTRLEDWWAKDKKFWRYRYNPDRVHISVIRDVAKAFETFKKGELDVITLNTSEYWYDKLPNSDPDVEDGYIHKAQFYNIKPRPTYGLWINEAKFLLDNRDVRVGINYASNWKLVIDKFFRGDYFRMRTTADGFGPFTHPTMKARPFDIDKALESFAKAGFTKRGPDGILVNGEGQRLSFTLSTGYESLKDVLTILKEEAAKAGLEFRLEVLDSTAAWKKVQEKKHDIHFSAFNNSLELYPRYWETYHSANAYDQAFLEDGSVNLERKLKTQTNNLQSLADPELDELIVKYDHSDDADEMIRLAYQMEEMLYEDASFVPGFIQPFYRTGYWRWVRFPADYSTKHSSYWWTHWVHWLDEARKEETLEARRIGTSFTPSVMAYDKYKTQ